MSGANGFYTLKGYQLIESDDQAAVIPVCKLTPRGAVEKILIGNYSIAIYLVSGTSLGASLGNDR